jgi:hypothetical protein
MNIHLMRDHLERMKTRGREADRERAATVPNPGESDAWKIDNMIGMCGDDPSPRGRHAGPRTTLGRVTPGRHRATTEWYEQ